MCSYLYHIHMFSFIDCWYLSCRFFCLHSAMFCLYYHVQTMLCFVSTDHKPTTSLQNKISRQHNESRGQTGTVPTRHTVAILNSLSKAYLMSSANPLILRKKSWNKKKQWDPLPVRTQWFKVSFIMIEASDRATEAWLPRVWLWWWREGGER